MSKQPKQPRPADSAPLEALRSLEAQLSGWHSLMLPSSPDFDPAFRPSLEAVRAAHYAASNAIAAAEA